MGKEPNINDLTYKFNEAASADAANRQRGQRNFLAIQGVMGSIYSPELIAMSKKTGIPLSSYNLLQKYIKGVAGSFSSNWFDPKFSSNEHLEELNTDLLTKLEDVYASAKEQNSYKISTVQCIFDGLIYRGVEEISIKRPEIGDPQTWSIDFNPVRADSIIFDPGVDQNQISRHARKAWKYTYPTAEELYKIYPDKKDAIKKAIEEQDLDNYDATDPRFSAIDPNTTKRNGKLQVVEYYHLEDETKYDWVFVPTWQKVEVPEDVESGKELEYVKTSLFLSDVPPFSVTDDNIIKVPRTETVLYIDVFIPELDIILDSGKDDRSDIGRLPFFAWSYLEVYGTPIGLVDILWDSQQDFLKREKSKTRWFEKSSQGKPYIHPDIVDGDQKKLKKIINEWGDPSKPIIVDEKVQPALVASYLGQLPGTQIPASVMQDEQFKIQLMDNISGLTPALQGVSERSGENGVLYTRKVIEGSIQQRIPQEFLMEHEHDKMDAWLKLVPKVYGGTKNMNRTFSATGRDNVMCNILEGYDEDGSPMLRDDLSNLKRIHIVIGKTNESDFAKQANRETDIEMLRSMQPSATNQEIIATIENNLVLNMDFNSEDEKQRTMEAVERRRVLDKLNMEAQIKALEGQIMGAELQNTKLETQLDSTDALEEVAKAEIEIQAAQAELQAKQAYQQLTGEGQPQGAPGAPGGQGGMAAQLAQMMGGGQAAQGNAQGAPAPQ